MIPILKMRQLRHGEIKELAPGHTASKGRRWHLNPDSGAPEACHALTHSSHGGSRMQWGASLTYLTLKRTPQRM